MEYPYNPEWTKKLVDAITAIPQDERERAIQEAVKGFGEARGATWEMQLQQLHTRYLMGLSGERQENERWAWFRAIMSNERIEEQKELLYLIINVMATTLERNRRNWKAELHEPFHIPEAEDEIKMSIVLSALADTSRGIHTVVAILSAVQKAIEQQEGLPQGSLMTDIAKIQAHTLRTLHLHVRVKATDAPKLTEYIRQLFGRGKLLLLLDVPERPDDERTIYYQQRLVDMPYDQESFNEMTEDRLTGLVQRLSLDKRVIAIQQTLNMNEGMPPL